MLLLVADRSSTTYAVGGPLGGGVMRIMYWNCTTPSGADNTFSAAKLKAIQDRVLTLQPHVLCLDEVSALVTDANDFAAKYLNSAALTYKAGPVIKNDGVHLNTVAFYLQPPASASAAPKFDVGIPQETWANEQTKRDLIRVYWLAGTSPVTLWFLHANASKSGGQTALDRAAKATSQKYAAFIGDFNTGCVARSDATTVAPTVGKYGFSQWKSEVRPAGGSGTMAGLVDVPGSSTYMVRPNPSGFIDFAVANKAGMALTPVDSLGSITEETLRTIMLGCDHFPIVFDVATK